MKIAIITACCGNGEKISTPSVIHSGVDYISFSDKIHDCSVWDQRSLVYHSEDLRYTNRRNAKIYKIIPHKVVPGYDYYFWVDASHDVIENPYTIIEKYLKDSDIAVFRHRERHCVYTEIEELIRLDVDHRHLLDKQVELYKQENYPYDNGLYELPVSVRRNTEITRNINEMWWDIIKNYSSRDQISLPYVLWKLNYQPSIIPGIVNGGLNNNDIMTQTRHHGH